MRAISVFNFETGTSTRWCLAAAALRMRVRKSPMGSVCMFSSSPLPARFHNARDFALERHAAEADSAHLKLTNVGARAATNAAAITHANLELGLLERLCDFCGTCHLLLTPWSSQREAEALEQLAAFLVVSCAGGERDVHTLDLVDAGVVDLWEHQLILETERVVAAAVKGIRWQAAEVANARQDDVAKPVNEFVHLVAAQGDRAADRHPLADLEIGDRLFRACDHRLLAADLAKFDGCGVEQLRVLAGFAEADVERDLLQLGHGHDVLPAEALHERRDRFASIFFLQSTLHCFVTFASCLPFTCPKSRRSACKSASWCRRQRPC